MHDSQDKYIYFFFLQIITKKVSRCFNQLSDGTTSKQPAISTWTDLYVYFTSASAINEKAMPWDTVWKRGEKTSFARQLVYL